MGSSCFRAYRLSSKHDAIQPVALQSVKRKAIGSDPETMSDLELWQLIVRCLHMARKKMGEQGCSKLAFKLLPEDCLHPTVRYERARGIQSRIFARPCSCPCSSRDVSIVPLADNCLFKTTQKMQYCTDQL